MKHFTLVVTLLAIALLAACATPPTETPAGATTTAPLTASTTVATAPSSTIDTTEEVEITNLVTGFGKRLQAVSLLSPNATQEIKEQYSEFVSPTLLEEWGNDVSKAPGRVVSSPWPDRIEIATLSKEGSDRYTISGFVIEVTSAETTTGGAAAILPVRLTAQRVQGHWLITEYAEEQ